MGGRKGHVQIIVTDELYISAHLSNYMNSSLAKALGTFT